MQRQFEWQRNANYFQEYLEGVYIPKGYQPLFYSHSTKSKQICTTHKEIQLLVKDKF